mmetsp:Transcript_18546/g.34214  ORF Transcript_18546/g.34214 Transcript_18546/m.34214 type:complete len:1515 (+) Transcript_18546:87-4631(+)
MTDQRKSTQRGSIIPGTVLQLNETQELASQIQGSKRLSVFAAPEIRQVLNADRNERALEIAEIKEGVRFSVAHQAAPPPVVELDEEDGDEEDSNAQGRKACNGLLIDFIYRLKADKQFDKDPNFAQQREVDAAAEDYRTAEKFYDETEVQAGYLAAVKQVNHEMLHSSLMADVVSFWKGLKDPPHGWAPDKTLLRQRIRDIALWKTQVKCLREEVKNWVLRRTLLISRAGTYESQGERYTRQQEFWAQFHEDHTKADVGRLAPSFKEEDERMRELYNVDPKVANERRLKTPTVRSRAATASHQKWKQRPTKSRTTAGNWDWTKGRETPGFRTTARRSKKNTSAGMWSFDEAPDPLPLEASIVGPWSAAEVSGEPTGMPPGNPAEKEKPSHRWWKSLQPPEATQSPYMKTYDGVSVNLPKSTSLPSLWKQSPRSIRRAGEKNDRSSELLELSREAPLKSREAPLPAITSAFSAPWHGKVQTPILKMEETPTKRYLKACNSVGNMPKPIPFVTGHSLKLETGGQIMNDSSLSAITEMIKHTDIEEADLGDNASLTERSLLKFLKTLSASKSLKMLSLKGCRKAGMDIVLTNVVKMLHLDEGAKNLQYLNLSSIPIWNKSHLALATAVGRHQKLKEFQYADTGLGECVQLVECIDLILGSRTITSLDLSWNCFTAEAFTHLGERLTEMGIVKSLSIANCSALGIPDHASPIVFFLEQLNWDFSLRSMDVQLNRMDFRAALVLEDALQSSKRLSELNISVNPLGELGMRCLLRLLCYNESGLMFFKCEDCSTATQGGAEGAETAAERYQIYCSTNPGGRYNLDLTRPYHRSLLRMLYKTSEKFKLTPDVSFSEISGTPAYTHAIKDSYGVHTVPTSGRLAVTFSVDKAMEDSMKSVPPDAFSMFISKHLDIMRVQPGFRKVVPLFAQWQSVDGRSKDQLVMLDALAKDFRLSQPQLEQLALSRGLVSDIVSRLLPSMKGGDLARYMTMLLLPSLGEFVRVLDRVRPLLTFNIENPNAHYVLDLFNHAEHSVAEQLLLLDRFECSIARQQQRLDVSQRGNYSQVRNERYQHRRLPVNSVAEWNLPEFDIFELDYSSQKRVPLDSQVLDDFTFSKLLLTLQQSDSSYEEQIQALRMCSHLIFVKSVQLRGLIGIYATEEARAEIFVLMFLRVVDFYNEKVFRVRFTKEEELHALNHRIGWVSLLPFMQPEQATFLLDFANYDQRLAANIILWLRGKESPVNVREPIFTYVDGTVDPLPQGVPRSWETFSKMPKSGTLRMSYMCSPEDRSFKGRKYLYEAYGFRRCPEKEEQVMWWAALNEAPEDVLEYLEFLIAKVGDPAKAFKIIDGEDGNGVISLREFEEGYREMECEKFKGKDERERIHAVFRYLDPSGEGQVSEDEWQMLVLLEREIRMSITEFVQFCERTFGKDLKKTWDYLDDDGSGEIDEDEWCSAVSKLGFFGPAKPIFNYLDKDDEGTVSLDEFEMLEEFQVEQSEGGSSRPTSKQSQRPGTSGTVGDLPI